jgi:prepilin-type N-terminal cleavage/methylation domain-containing protein
MRTTIHSSEEKMSNVNKPETRNPKPEPSPNDQTGMGEAILRRARGFTLIEMITVLSIIIIVLAIAIPVWNALLGGTNLTAAQNKVAAVLANARADAIYNRQTIGVFFYTDPKTQQVAMTEVQVQVLYQPHPYPPTAAIGYTSLFVPGSWTYTSSTNITWQGTPYSTWNDLGPINSLELVNSTDPSTGNINFYRDPVYLPKGVAVALNNDTYNYNLYATWLNPNPPSNPTTPPIDRYLRTGCIMFNPDGTLASIPWGVPYFEWFSAAQYNPPTGSPTAPTENLLCKAMGMPTYYDTASTYTPGGGSPPVVPLLSSVGLVIYDHDTYLNQHATMQVTVAGAATTIGDGAQFDDSDMIASLLPTSTWVTNPPQQSPPTAPPPGNGFAAHKFCEESWIDQNGTAMLVSPFNGSLIKAK